MTCAETTLTAPDQLLCPAAAAPYALGMSGRLEDSALMLRYQEGDLSAFETLYRRHNASLYRYLLRLCLNREVAEDLFQEAWSRIISSRSRYRATAKFSTYLFHIAHNCFIDHVRRSRRYATVQEGTGEAMADPADSPELQVERLLARRRLHASLVSLPAEQREAFLLREEGNLSIDEIARVTGVNRETAKSRLRYAVGKLKASIAGPCHDRQQAAEQSDE